MKELFYPSLENQYRKMLSQKDTDPSLWLDLKSSDKWVEEFLYNDILVVRDNITNNLKKIELWEYADQEWLSKLK